MASGYQIQGMDQLLAKLKKIERLADHPESMVAGGYVVEKHAKQNAPVETGFMRGSITTEQVSDGAEVRVGASYGIHVETGTSKMAAQPFLRPAVLENQDEIVDAVVKDLQKHLK